MPIGSVKFTISEPGIRALLQGPTSPVYRYVDLEAKRVKQAAEREAPVKTGKLKRSIRVTRDWPGLPKGSAAVVADTDYALAVENGSKPHTIRPKNATMLRFPSRGGGMVYAYSVEHPGTKANPFMQRALNSVRR